MRAALAYCISFHPSTIECQPSILPGGPPDTALRLAGAMQPFWGTRGHISEGRKWLADVLSQSDAAAKTTSRARALDGAGALARIQSDYSSARALHEEALAIYWEMNDPEGLANALNNLGIVARQQGDYAAAKSFYERSLRHYREMSNLNGVAGSLCNLANVAHSLGDLSAAQDNYEEALALSREIGNRPWEALSLNGLGNVAHAHRDLVAARTLYEQGLRIRRELGDPRSLVLPLDGLGELARDTGDLAAARVYLTEALTISRQLRMKYAVTLCLHNFAALARAEGHPEDAAMLYGAAAATRESIGAVLSPENTKAMEPELAVLQSTLGAERFSAAYRSGQALNWEQAVVQALQEPAE
jgi:tetratricopeptide (TPR) repeat protein